MSRFDLLSRRFGMRHRVKQTAEGAARPTQMCLLVGDGSDPVLYELPTETDELDFVLGRFVTAHRKIREDDVLGNFLPHQLKTRALKKGESITDFPDGHVLKIGKKEFLVVTHVPASHDGLKKGDIIGACLGGSGDKFSYALSRQADELGGDTKVFRIPTFALKNERGAGDKDNDATLLAHLVREKQDLFQLVTPRERDLIHLAEGFGARVEAMKARIGCEQRLRQSFIGKLFCTPEGKYPEGSVEEQYDALKVSDVILSALEKEENARNRDLEKILARVEVYNELFAPIEGVGPMIASRIIVAVKDVRRFATKDKLVRFCGVHVADGKFPRRRAGSVANWHPDARQGLFLLGDQMNRRPDSVWGKKLRENKARLLLAHPEPVVGENGKKRYTPAHIQKMALWRTITRFVQWLWKEWWKIEVRHGAVRPVQHRKGRCSADASTPVPSSADTSVGQVEQLVP